MFSNSDKYIDYLARKLYNFCSLRGYGHLVRGVLMEFVRQPGRNLLHPSNSARNVLNVIYRDGTDYYTPLKAAVFSSNLDAVRLLLEIGYANPNIILGTKTVLDIAEEQLNKFSNSLELKRDCEQIKVLLLEHNALHAEDLLKRDPLRSRNYGF